MDEAEKLSHRLIMMSRGKIVAEGVPSDLIRAKVSRYALEIREAEGVSLNQSDESIMAVQRGTVHLYFAENTQLLTPLMNLYGSRPMLLRPSNLEDVFLQIAD
jgi:ABC-type multidrug transport system ATPase subunit